MVIACDLLLLNMASHLKLLPADDLRWQDVVAFGMKLYTVVIYFKTCVLKKISILIRLKSISFERMSFHTHLFEMASETDCFCT